jgi:hypothetical protein
LKIYYAHAIWLYSTTLERMNLRRIRQRFRNCRIVNPALLRAPKADPHMQFYLDHVESCDCLVFSRLANKITAGVGKEVRHAFSLKKPVYEIKSNRLRRIRKPVKALSRKATVTLFAKLNYTN